MIIVKTQLLKSGKRRMTIDLDSEEAVLAYQPGGFYKLGYPFEEVIETHIIKDMKQVHWCPVGQEWVT